MKQVIQVSQKASTTPADQVSASKEYAFKLKGCRGIVICSQSLGGVFSVVSEICKPFPFTIPKSDTLQQQIEKLLELGAEVCEFDTDIEMYKWLSV